MAQALIKINAVIGSDDDLPLDTLVQLDNQNVGGEVTYLWEILDQPAGAPDVLSSATIQNPTFTPKKEGTYLLRLTVNAGLPSEDVDTAIAAVRQLKTRERVPAAGETLEDNPSRGWAEDTNTFLRTLDSFIADPGTVVGVNKTGGTLARGTVVRATSRETIKAGLPGEEDLPGFTAAPATDAFNLDELLLIVEQGVDGSDPVSAGGLIIVRWLGRIAALPLGAGAVGDRVNVSDSADLSTTPGTNIRQVGSIMAVDGVNRDVWFSGTQGGNKAPDDRAYVVYGNPGPLSNALRVDGLSAGPVINNIPFTVRGGDATTIPFVVKRFSAGATANLQEIHNETGTILARFDKDGELLVPSLTIAGNLNVGGDLTVGDTNYKLILNGTVAELHGDLSDTKPLAYDRATDIWRISDELEVLDPDFGLFGNTFTPKINFAPDDRLEYVRLSNAYQFVIDNFLEMSITVDGVTIVNGLRVGDAASAPFDNDVVALGGIAVGVDLDPADNTVVIGDPNFFIQLDGTPDAVIQFDTGPDSLVFDRSADTWRFKLTGSDLLSIAEIGTGEVRFGDGAGYEFDNNSATITAVEIDGGSDAPTLRLIPEGDNPTSDLQAGAFFVESGSEGLHQYNTNFAEWVPIVEQIQHTPAQTSGTTTVTLEEVIYKTTFGLNALQHRPNVRWNARFQVERAGVAGQLQLEWRALNGTFASGSQPSLGGTVLANFLPVTGSGLDLFASDLLIRFANDGTTFDSHVSWWGNATGETELDQVPSAFTPDDLKTEIALIVVNGSPSNPLDWVQYIVTVEQM